MPWVVTPSVSILMITTVILAMTTWMIWNRRSALGGSALFWLMGSVLTWAFTGAMEAASVGMAQKLFWSKLSYLGIAPAAPLLFMFSLVFTRHKNWITPRRLAVLWTVPLLTVFLAATNEFHGLIWSRIVPNNQLNLLIYQHGPAFWAYTVYAYLCIALADLVLSREYRLASAPYRRQIRAIIISTCFPWVGNLIYLSGRSPVPGLDTTILFCAATGILLAITIGQSELLALLPVAHEALLQQMQDGVIVIDSDNRVVETNPAAAYLLDKLALLDVDNFKQINDQLGHAAGDAALRTIAKTMRSNLRSIDLAARLGGDEFLLAMQNTGIDQSYVVIERIRSTIGADFMQSHEIRISMSAGITAWLHDDTPEAGLKRVDGRLYEAKRQGKDCIIADGARLAQSK